MRTMFVGDLHGMRMKYAEAVMERIRREEKPDLVIQVGDFGYYPKSDPWPLEKDILEGWKLFIRGNHEDHHSLPLDATEIQPTEYGNWGFIPDGYFLDGIFFIGGAFSIDRGYRPTGPYRWHEEEQLSAAQERAVFDKLAEVIDDVKVVVTHDGPASIYRRLISHHGRIEGHTPVFHDHIMEFIDEHGGRVDWVFGHHHKHVELYRKKISFTCLDMWRPAEASIDYKIIET